MKAIDRAEQAMETSTGRAADRIVKLAFGIILVALLAIQTSNSNDLKDAVARMSAKDARQDIDIAQIQEREKARDVTMAANKRVVDEQVQTLKAIQLQLVRMQDDIDNGNRGHKR